MKDTQQSFSEWVLVICSAESPGVLKKIKIKKYRFLGPLSSLLSLVSLLIGPRFLYLKEEGQSGSSIAFDGQVFKHGGFSQVSEKNRRGQQLNQQQEEAVGQHVEHCKTAGPGFVKESTSYPSTDKSQNVLYPFKAILFRHQKE